MLERKYKKLMERVGEGKTTGAHGERGLWLKIYIMETESEVEIPRAQREIE